MKLTEEQARQMAANAVNASVPMGFGFIHHQVKTYTPDDVQLCVTKRGIRIDYFDGRMVKLYIRKVEDDYLVPEQETRVDYQSWCRTYPTYQALFDSVVGGD